MVPFIDAVLLGEQLARRFIVQAHSAARTGSTAVGWYVNVGLLALLTLGLVLSLMPTRQLTLPRVRASSRELGHGQLGKDSLK